MIDEQIIQKIVEIDPAFEPLLTKFPIYPLITHKLAPASPFSSLVETVISQQLSGKAAETIANRLKAAIELTPEKLATAEIDTLRSCGLSGAKVKTIQELSRAVLSGLDLDELSKQPTSEIRTALINIWGIGNWTVDMFLMFDLREPDVWPVNDLGVQKGWQLLHGLPERPSPDQLLIAGESFAGFRSPVAWFCWRALEIN